LKTKLSGNPGQAMGAGMAGMPEEDFSIALENALSRIGCKDKSFSNLT